MNFTFDEKKHVYKLDDKPLMGVTSVLGIIAKPALIQWAANMACDYINDNFPTAEEFMKDPHIFTNLIKEARTAHRKKKEKAADAGTDVHGLVEQYINDCIAAGETLNPVVENPALQGFIDWAITNKIKFVVSEKRMYSEEWWVAGTCDLVFEQDGKKFLGDVKTQARMWDRVPFIQMGAYTKMYQETTGEQIDGTCVILIPREKPVLETFYCYDHESDIKTFEAALRLYKSVPLTN